jgi:TPP-dependent trihydroxycyclohexane-1,2-dione (THcHDO) dehydratase
VAHRDPKGYHVEYGYSCMGYEIAGGLGVALAIRDAGETDRRRSSWSATGRT